MNLEMHIRLGQLWQHSSAPSGLHEASKRFEFIIQADPSHILAHFLLAQTYYSRGLAKEAITAYTRVVDLHPRHCEALYNLLEATYQAAANLTSRRRHEQAAAACIRLQLEQRGSATIHPMQALRYVPTAAPLPPDDPWYHHAEKSEDGMASQSIVTDRDAIEGEAERGVVTETGNGGGSLTGVESQTTVSERGRGATSGNSVLTSGVDAMVDILSSSDPSNAERSLRPETWPPVPKRPIQRLRIGYMSGSWEVLPLVVSRALEFYDHDRTTISVYDIGSRALTREHSSVLFGADVVSCCVHWLGGNGREDAAAEINRQSVHILVDFDAGVSDDGARVAAHHPAPVQVRGWGSLWPVSAHVKALPRLVSDKIISPPEYAADWSERLILMPHVPAVPAHWLGEDPSLNTKEDAQRWVPGSHGVVLGYVGETTQINEETANIWRNTLSLVQCKQARVVLIMSDYMQVVDLMRPCYVDSMPSCKPTSLLFWFRCARVNVTTLICSFVFFSRISRSPLLC